MAVFLGFNQYWPDGFMFCLWFYVQEHPKAQPAVFLVLKRLRRRATALSLIRQTGSSGNPWFTRHRLKTFCGLPWAGRAGRVYDLCVYYTTGVQRRKRAFMGRFSHFQFLTFFNRYMFKLLIV